jgi:hypothetical protein
MDLANFFFFFKKKKKKKVSIRAIKHQDEATRANPYCACLTKALMD